MAGAATVRMSMPVRLTSASDVQAALDANPIGTTFLLAPGTYRPVSQGGYAPKHHQRLIGATLGVKLSGAKVLTGWTQAGSQWWASGFLPGAANGTGVCETGTLCTERQDVFRDGAPLTRVASIAAATAGKFFTDYTANRVYVGDDPAGHLVEQAWANNVVKSTNGHVTVSNVVVEMAANDAQTGAISAAGVSWTVDHVEGRYNHGAAVELTTAGRSWVHHNYLHRNGQIGVTGQGANHLVEGNEIAWNNNKGFAGGWDAGGMKTGEATWYDCVVRGNWVHDNQGPGIWNDVNAGTTDIDGNYVRDNRTGIMFEISFGTRPAAAGGGGVTLIRNNIVAENYDPAWPGPGLESSFGIVNMASPDVEVSGNSVYAERGGIMGFQQDRGSTADPRGPWEIKNFNVHDNFVDMNGVDPNWSGKVGLWTDIVGGLGADIYTAGYNNHFENNDYRHSNASIGWFDWSATFRTFAQWQAFAAGHDDTGSMTAGAASTIPNPPSLTVGPQP